MRVLFLGLGSIGQRHLRNIRSLYGDDVEVLAYRVKREVPLLGANMDAQADTSISEAFNVREFEDLGEALAEQPELVFVTNPSSMHMQSAIDVSGHAHVFVEKPLAHASDQLETLKEILKRSKKVLSVGYQFRFHPGLIAVKSWLDEGRIGQIVKANFVNGEYLPNWHPYEDYRQGYAAKAELGGGALLTQIHDFDLAIWLIGMPSSVYTVGGQLSGLDVDVEDSVSVLMNVDKGGLNVPVTIDLDYLRRPPKRSITIVGDEGQVEWDFHTGFSKLFVDGEIVQTIDTSEIDRNQMFEEELRNFVEATKGNEKIKVDLDEGIKSLMVALAAKRSLSSGRVENL